jgi:hypothetical protein
LKLAVEDELVALGAQVYGEFSSEEDKGEDVAVLQDRLGNGQYYAVGSTFENSGCNVWIGAYLFATPGVECKRIEAVGYCVAYEWDPVEDQGRL